LTPPTPTERVQLAAENFAGANSADIGANWDAGYTNCAALKLQSNEVSPSALNQEARETYNAITTPDSQWIQARMPKFLSGVGCGLLLRWANAPTNVGYVFQAIGFNPSCRIEKFASGGVYSVPAQSNAHQWQAGDYIRAEIETPEGSSVAELRMYCIRNGVETQVLNATDPSPITSGKVGLGMYNITADDRAFADVTIGGFAAAGDTFARVATVVTDATGADLTFTGLAHKVRYKNDLNQITPVEVTGLGGVSTYRLSKVWEPEITYACFEAQGSDGVWETSVDPNSYVCYGVTPSPGDTTPPDAPTDVAVH
jgi:hypothetical protein